MSKKSSFFDHEKFKQKTQESFHNDEPHKLKIKMENLVKKYFKKEPSILIYFILEDEKKIEKIDLNSIEKNKINLEIKSWKKKLSDNSLIQTFLEVIKSNNIQTQNLNQILKDLNYININEDFPQDQKDQNNSLNENINKITKGTSSSEQNENDEESSIFNNSMFSIENILNINVNKDIKKKQEIGHIDKEEESSCNAEYFESTVLPLDELKDFEMQSNSKDKENNNTDNISEDNSSNYSKKNLSAMEFLKRKTKNHFSKSYNVKKGEANI